MNRFSTCAHLAARAWRHSTSQSASSPRPHAPASCWLIAIFSVGLTAQVAAAAERYRPSPDELRQSYNRAEQVAAQLRNRAYKLRIESHWLPESTAFWYRNDLADDRKEFVFVDATTGARTPAFDHERLASALGAATGEAVSSDKLPFAEIEFVDDRKAIKFNARGKNWRCDLASYVCASLGDNGPAASPTQPERRWRRRDDANQPPPRVELRSPDGNWTVLVRDHNVVLRANSDARETTLSSNGQPAQPFGELSWSPDSKTIVGYRVDRAEILPVHVIESSPAEGGRAKLRSNPYELPGDKMTSYEMWLFHVEAKDAVQAQIEPIDFHGPPQLRWNGDSRHFTLERTDRGHQRFRIVEVDATSGQIRNLYDERSSTFINGVGEYTHYVGDAEIIRKSERDGWAHLYLIDRATLAIQPITRGEWVVRSIDRVDQEKRQIWFQASGMTAGEDPYFLHGYRVNFDGGGLVDLTAEPGHHRLQYSPDNRYLVDSYSQPDAATKHVLRQTTDGRSLCEFERADVMALDAAGWKPPEVFHTAGRDGVTQIWGLVTRPRSLDPNKLYPVIELIYAGPHDSHVPKSFGPNIGLQSLAELGFIVVQIDGMGTANRSKAFHDACWRNLGDAGLPDRIIWIKALAAKYPYVDATRVGIYGTSAGGQNTMSALLEHGEFYQVGVASCGCYDNRMDKTWWNEQWMGYPIGPHYAQQSAITNAHKLRGKLLLFVGELDDNVPPESTYRLVDALIKADKQFDFLTFPGMGHSDGGRHGERRRRDFFVRHLHGVEPPDRNAPPESTAAPTGVATSPSPKTAIETSAKVATGAIATSPPTVSATATGVDLREMIELYVADIDSLRHVYGIEHSVVRRERMAQFHRDMQAGLGRVSFASLSQPGKVDYLLLKHHLARELRNLELEARSDEELLPLAPFLPQLLGLEEARRRMEFVEPAAAAARLHELTQAVAASRDALEAKLADDDAQARPKPAVALRAASAVVAAQRTLRRWHDFYHGYDPLFTWWATAPHKRLDEALERHAEYLRERIAGVRSKDRDTIIGDPIGRDKLLSELAGEWIPYAPEELLKIADREFAWCEEEMKKASREMGFGDDWRRALDAVKQQFVPPGDQPKLIKSLHDEAIRFLEERDLVTIPPLAKETWRMEMMTPERQRVNPFFTGGRTISVSFPTDAMEHDEKLMTLRGNNRYFSRATVFHELIPGHHLQGHQTQRYRTYRELFRTPFWIEGWALYWEMLMWDLNFPTKPEERVGMLFWRMHRAARIAFSLRFHLGEMSAEQCVDFLVERVGHERENARGEVRRSVEGGYAPLYQAAYMLGGLQLRSLHRELVASGRMTAKRFHDALLEENAIPIELIRASLTGQDLSPDTVSRWRFD